jgi:hypothetical protein
MTPDAGLRLDRGTSRKWLLLPGTLFWVSLIATIITGSHVLISITGALGVGTFLGFGAFAIARARRDRAVKRRVWATGIPATAKVVRSLVNGSLNDHPYVEMHLEVTDGTGRISFADVRQVISQIHANRCQPGSEFPVKIDRDDRSIVVVDPELTPYGY